jgi:RHS repeat-associated protein
LIFPVRLLRPLCPRVVLAATLTCPPKSTVVRHEGFRAFSLLVLAAIGLLGTLRGHAQEVSTIAQAGSSVPSSYQPNGIDTINLQNGAVVLNIPVLSYPQLGDKLKLSFSLKYSPTFWFYVPGPPTLVTATPHIEYVGDWFDSDPQAVSSVGVTLTRDQALWATTEQLNYICSQNGGSPCPAPLNGSQAAEEKIFANLYSLVTSDNAVHNFGINDNDNHFAYLPTLDGSNFVPVGSGPQVPTTFLGPNGIRYTPAPSSAYPGANGFNQTDPDGNTITTSSSGWTDSIGRQIPGSYTGPGDGHTTRSTVGDPIPGTVSNDLSGCSPGATAARVWNVPGPNAGTSTYILCFTSQTAATAFVSPNSQPAVDSVYSIEPGGQGQGSYLLLTQLVLPNNTSYKFTYDSWLELESITLPTGGSITYGWTTNAWASADVSHQQTRTVQSRTVKNTDGTSHTWTYAFSAAAPGAALPGTQYATAVITDPNGNDEEHDFSNAPTSLMPTETVNSYSGTGTSRTLLKTITSTREQLFNPIIYPSVPGANNGGRIPLLGPVVSESTTWPGSNLVSQTTYTIAPSTGNYTYYDFNENTGGPFGPHAYNAQTCSSCWSTFQPQVVSESDYGTGQPGQLLRQTNTQYQWQQNPSYLSANLLTIPASVKTLNGAGTQVAETDYAYDESGYVANSGTFAGSLTTVSNWLNTGSSVVSHTSYNNNGMPTQTLDPKGNAISTTYQCSRAFPYQVTNALNQTTTYGYDCNTGLLTSVKDPNSAATGYSYDSSGNMIQATYPDGGNVGINYNGYSVPLTLTTTTAAAPDPSMVSTLAYDGFGRPSTSTAPSGAITNTAYDGNGRISSVTNPHFSSPSSTDGTTGYAYDALGRLTVQTQPDGSTQTHFYNGNTDTFTDEDNHSWQRTSDALGRLANVVEPTGASTGYIYDALNNLLTVNQNGVSGETQRTRGFVYDSLSRLTSSTNPETGTIGYGYDANGNVTSKTDARGITATYSYDALNRLTQKSYSDGITPTVIYGYDSSGITFVPSSGSASGRVTASLAHTIGRLAFASNTSGGSLYAYSYDVMGRLTNQWLSTPSFNAGTSPVFSIGATFDLAGNVTSLTYPDGRVLNREWNGAGELQQIADQQTLNGQPYLYFTPQSTYYPDGSSNTVWRGNGVASGVDKNNRLQPWAINASRIGASAAGVSDSIGLMLKEYCYGPSVPSPSPNELPSCPSLSGGNSGNIQEIIDGTVSGHTQTFTYDSVNRLTSFSQLDGSVQQNYIYDSFGNLGAVNPTTNRLSNLPCASSVTPFDAAGNQLCDTDSNGMMRQYSFDAEDRMTQIAILGNAPFESYLYDANGGRIQKTNANGTYTEYVDFNGQPMAEFSSDGSWSDYIFDNGERLARADNYDVRIHMSGTNCSGCSSTNTFAGTQSLTAANGTVVQSGDLLTWRQYQDGVASGGISIGFTLNNEGTSGVLVAADGQKADADTRTGAWYLRVADLSAYAGLTIGSMNLYNFQGGAPGNWDIYLGDIVLVHANGTSLSLYDRSVAGLAPFTPGAAESNVSVITEKVFNNANPQTTSVLTSTTFYEGDQVGSAILLTNSGGWPIYTDVFYPFGAEATAPLDPNHYKFTGKERDAESGLDYFGARYYASSMGRFMSPDPLGPWVANAADPQSWNMYAYARNNPLVNTDPTGYDCVYLNNAGTGIDQNGIDTNSNSGECGNNGGYWVDGTFTSGTVYSNSNDVYLHGYDSSSGQLTDSYSNVVTANGNSSQINTDVFSGPNIFAPLPTSALNSMINSLNRSGQSNKLVGCIVAAESSGNPQAAAGHGSTAKGLMQVNNPTAGDIARWYPSDFGGMSGGQLSSQMTDSATAIVAGTDLLNHKIGSGSLANGLGNYYGSNDPAANAAYAAARMACAQKQ